MLLPLQSKSAMTSELRSEFNRTAGSRLRRWFCGSTSIPTDSKAIAELRLRDLIRQPPYACRPRRNPGARPEWIAHPPGGSRTVETADGEVRFECQRDAL